MEYFKWLNNLTFSANKHMRLWFLFSQGHLQLVPPVPPEPPTCTQSLKRIMIVSLVNADMLQTLTVPLLAESVTTGMEQPKEEFWS